MLLARALTPLQQTVLTTVVRLCPDPGQEVRDDVVARDNRISRRTVVLSAKALEKRGLIASIPEHGVRVLRPTWNGREWVRNAPRADERTRFAREGAHAGAGADAQARADANAGAGADAEAGAPGPAPEPRLTPAQLIVLSAVLRLCPEPGQEARGVAVGELAGLTGRAVALAVAGLEQQDLVRATHDGPSPVVRPTERARAFARLATTGDEAGARFRRDESAREEG